MTFAFKSLVAAAVMAGGLGISAASAMPMAGADATAVPAVQTEKAAVVCIGRCYRGFGYRGFGYRGYGYRGYGYRGYGYRPYAFYGHRRFGYYR